MASGHQITLRDDYAIQRKNHFDKVTLTKRLGRLNVSAADDLLAAEDAVCFVRRIR